MKKGGIFMKNNFSTKRLPQQFKGRGIYAKCEYLTIMRKNGFGLFTVQNAIGSFHWEIAEIRAYVTYESKRPVQLYPDSSQIGKYLWQFSDYDVALESFKSIVCENA